MKRLLVPRYPFYRKHEWHIAAACFIFYVLIAVGSNYLIPGAAQLYPAAAVALCALFFGGLRLWPAVYLAALLSGVLTGISPTLLMIMPLGYTLEAVAGASLLREGRVDPIFRRNRDMFHLFITILIVSFISPTLTTFASVMTDVAYTPTDWGYGYLATAFCFLILVPFMLRWFTKPRFSRTPKEAVETVTVFALLIIINFAIFIVGKQIVAHIPLVYLLLAPLFWIALRLRPRFVTLSLLITSLFAISGAIVNANDATLGTLLFNTESFLIVLSVIFLIVTSLEEDRRVNTNLMLSHLAALENTLSQASSESRAKNDFIAILAHELRNPLAPVVSAIDLMKLKGPHDEEDAEALDIMADRMSAIKRLLDDLLDISRISEGKIMLKKDRVDLGYVMEQALLSTEHHRAELHQYLALTPPARPLIVQGDPIRIEQIFSNLLTNASKYSNAGDTITIRMHEREGRAEVEIKDQGIGLEPHETELIFQPFKQIQHGARTAKGLGIGLSLVQSFIEMHKGTIAVTSEGRGRGSRFTVTFPLIKASSGTAKEQVPAQERPRFIALIIDKNDAAAGNIGRLFELQDCAVVYAYDEKQAIEKMLTHAPQFILLDVDMPYSDGTELAKTLRERGFQGRLIALTAYRAEGLAALDRNTGFDDFMVKPVGVQEIRRVFPEL